MRTKQINVFILCGGLGTRLRSISKEIPKSMIRIGKRPFLDLIITFFALRGFRKFVLGVGYKSEVIRDYYGRNKAARLKIAFSQEHTPLDTGGSIAHAAKKISGRLFFVVNGDTFCEFDPVAMVKFHNRKKAVATILVRPAKEAADYGQIVLGRSNRIMRFSEKGKAHRGTYINAGVYLFDKRVFAYMPKQRRFSLEKDFFPFMVNKGLFGYPYSDSFVDIGTPSRLRRARRLLSGRVPLMRE